MEIDDRGTITGMDAVVGQLTEAHPYLVRDEADDADLYDDDDDPDVPSGRPMNGRRQTTPSFSAGTRPFDATAGDRTPTADG